MWFFRAVADSLNSSIRIYVESNEIYAQLTLVIRSFCYLHQSSRQHSDNRFKLRVSGPVEKMLSITSPTRDTSNEKRYLCVKICENSRTDKRKIVIESDQTSSLINEEKHIGGIKYERHKTFLAEKKMKTFFLLKTNKQTSKKAPQPRDFRLVGRLF